jgi:hypothetical protein
MLPPSISALTRLFAFTAQHVPSRDPADASSSGQRLAETCAEARSAAGQGVAARRTHRDKGLMGNAPVGTRRRIPISAPQRPCQAEDICFIGSCRRVPWRELSGFTTSSVRSPDSLARSMPYFCIFEEADADACRDVWPVRFDCPRPRAGPGSAAPAPRGQHLDPDSPRGHAMTKRGAAQPGCFQVSRLRSSSWRVDKV